MQPRYQPYRLGYSNFLLVVTSGPEAADVCLLGCPDICQLWNIRPFWGILRHIKTYNTWHIAYGNAICGSMLVYLWVYMGVSGV